MGSPHRASKPRSAANPACCEARSASWGNPRCCSRSPSPRLAARASRARTWGPLPAPAKRFPPFPLLRSPKRKLREIALLLPQPIPSACGSGFKGKDMGTTQRTNKALPAAPPAAKPEAQAEGIRVAAPESHSLGSRLGLQGQGHGFQSARQQSTSRRPTCCKARSASWGNPRCCSRTPFPRLAPRASRTRARGPLSTPATPIPPPHLLRSPKRKL